MNKIGFFAVIILALLVLGVAYFRVLPQPEASEQAAASATEEGAQLDTETADLLEKFDYKAALEDRIVGDINAPIKISEHASLTCGHCAHFHKTSFDTVKKELIDSGKAYLVFSDFPLNAPALRATMISRCLPHDRYFDFIHMLFETQDDWAYSNDYLAKLTAKAGEFGLDEQGVKVCLASKELEEGIVARMKAAQTLWKVESTPSFIINNKTLISGALPAEDFIKKVNEAVQ